MKKFEYLIGHHMSEYDLNTLGQMGWELIFIEGSEYIFKREIV